MGEHYLVKQAKENGAVESYKERQDRFKAEKATVMAAGRLSQVTDSKFYRGVRVAIESAVARFPGALNHEGRVAIDVVVDFLTALDSANLRVVPTKPTMAMADASMGALRAIRTHPGAENDQISTVDKHTHRLQHAINHAPDWKVGFALDETEVAVGRVTRAKDSWRETYMPEQMARRRAESRAVAASEPLEAVDVPAAQEVAPEAVFEAVAEKWPKTRESIRTLVGMGKTAPEIARLTGYNKFGIYNTIKAMGLAAAKVQSARPEILKMIRSEASTNDIIAATGATRTYVHGLRHSLKKEAAGEVA